LTQGSSGPQVVELQQDLNQNGAALDEDGRFGPLTRKAVLAFQQANGLAADGIVGPHTWAALDASIVAPAPSNPPPPGRTNPTAPGASHPTAPGASNPSAPGASNPSAPGTIDPTAPIDSESVAEGDADGNQETSDVDGPGAGDLAPQGENSGPLAGFGLVSAGFGGAGTGQSFAPAGFGGGGPALSLTGNGPA